MHNLCTMYTIHRNEENINSIVVVCLYRDEYKREILTVARAMIFIIELFMQVFVNVYRRCCARPTHRWWYLVTTII